jgi:NRPS condensation-like uncharacterized protein
MGDFDILKQRPIATRPSAGPGHPFVSNHAMVVRIRGSFSIEELHTALDGIRFRHPVLIPAAKTEDPLASHFQVQEVTGCAESGWKEIVKEELLKPFPPEPGPFARFNLLRLEGRSDLVGVFHHGICDGMSGVYVMRDILRLLGEPDLELPAIPKPPDTRTLIPPSVRESRRVQRRVNGFLKSIRLSLFLRRASTRVFPTHDRNRLDGNTSAEVQPTSQRMCILTETLTADQTTELVAHCKAERTSIHAAICVAWLMAFAAQLEGWKSWTRSASSPISLRERLSIPETSGLFMATAVTKINCTPRRDFWQVAREFKRKMNLASTDENLFLFPVMIGAVFSQLPKEDLKEVLPTLFNRPVRYDFSITNLGRLDLPVKIGSLEVEAFYNLVNTSEHERTICVNTFNDRLTFSCLFRESKMDPRRAEKLMELVKEQLSKEAGW